MRTAPLNIRVHLFLTLGLNTIVTMEYWFQYEPKTEKGKLDYDVIPHTKTGQTSKNRTYRSSWFYTEQQKKIGIIEMMMIKF